MQEIACGYSVDVVISFNTDLVERIEHFKKKASGVGYEKDGPDAEIISMSRYIEYSLKDNKQTIEDELINKLGSTYTESTYYTNCPTYDVTYYPIAEFKRKTFKCVGVEYSDRTGRVSKMTFKEI